MAELFSRVIAADAGDFEVLHMHAADGDAEADIAVLSADEQTRAARFVDPAQGRDWAFFRAELRRVLGARLGMPAAEVPIAYGAAGKPRLVGHKVEFNLSHAGRDGLLALAAVPIGVDLERHDRGLRDVEALAARVLTLREQARLRQVPEGPARQAAFLRLWAAKEAVAKALGTGLGTPLEQIEIDPAGADAVNLGADRWRIVRLRLPEPLIGAVALRA